jgi:hypothetical protein
MSVFEHVPHHWIAGRKAAGPVTQVADQAAGGVNDRIALAITKAVGTMWCAYLFAAISLYGLPQALRPGGEGLVSWIAQTFLQLVLLSIIIVGTNVAAAAADKRAEATYLDAEAVLHEAQQIQAHLQVQDDILTGLAAVLTKPPRAARTSGGRAGT